MNRRSLIITFAVCLLAVAVAFVVKRCPRTVPFEQCSELYQRYADTEGIDASFIQGYRLNDSVRVDVTLLQATDSAAWMQLITDYGIDTPPKELEKLYREKNIQELKYIPQKDPKLPMDTNLSANNVLCISWGTQTLCLFHTDEERQVNAIIKRNIHDAINNSKN